MRAPMEECEGAAGLKAIGAEHLIIDAPAEELSATEFLSQIKKFNPDLVILAVTFGSLESDTFWAKKIKAEFPQIKVGIRGAPAYTLAEKILKQGEIDLCIKGDYELTMMGLSKYGLEQAPGVTYRDSHGNIKETKAEYAECLDELPIPDRSTINSSLYKVRGLKAAQATIHVQRGCPFPCTYCLVHTVSGDKARHRSAESIVSEISTLQKQGINFFYFRAETFTLDKRWALALAKALQTHCKGIRWVTTTRVECVDQELLFELKKAGCYGISFGIDVASNTIGEKVKKTPKLKVAKKAMRMCDKAGIISLGYFMVGFVWETPETLRETEQFIKGARPNLITIHYAHPYPGTVYFNDVAKEEVKLTSLKAQAEPAFLPKALKSSDLKSFSKRVFLKHYINPLVLYPIVIKLIPLFFISIRNRLVYQQLNARN